MRVVHMLYMLAGGQADGHAGVKRFSEVVGRAQALTLGICDTINNNYCYYGISSSRFTVLFELNPLEMVLLTWPTSPAALHALTSLSHQCNDFP